LNFVRAAQKPQENFRPLASNYQHLESYEYEQCYYAKRSSLLAEVVECLGEMFQTRWRLRLRGGENLYSKSGTTQSNGSQSEVMGLEEPRSVLPSSAFRLG